MAFAPNEKNYFVDISQSLIALYSTVWVWTLNSFAFVKLAQICSGLPFMLYTCAMTFTHTEGSRRDISAHLLGGLGVMWDFGLMKVLLASDKGTQKRDRIL